jgi:hypothetical protein
MYLSPLAEHLLDWFHVAMRITVMGQMNKGMRETESASLIEGVEKQLESLKHHLWNGNVGPAQTLINVLKLQIEGESISLERKKLLKAVQEFAGYIAANADFIPDYGDRYRNDETITTAFVESTVNQVVSKRMVKKQPMRWSQKGAHLLLQVWTQVLNEELRATFRKWYPGMDSQQAREDRAA